MHPPLRFLTHDEPSLGALQIEGMEVVPTGEAPAPDSRMPARSKLRPTRRAPRSAFPERRPPRPLRAARPAARAPRVMTLLIPLSTRFTRSAEHSGAPLGVRPRQFPRGGGEHPLVGQSAPVPLLEQRERFRQGVGDHRVVHAPREHGPERGEEGHAV